MDVRALLRLTPALFTQLGSDGTIEFVDGGGLALLGLSPADLIGRSAFELYADVPWVVDALRRVLAGETLHTVGDYGGRRFSAWWQPDGAGALGVALDISELRDSEERYRTLANATFEGIAIHERGIMLDANEELARMSGYSRDELIGRSALTLAAPESRELVARNIAANLEGPYEAVGLRKDRTTLFVELRGRATVYQGRTVRLTAIRDITAERAARLELRKAEERLRMVLSTMPIVLFAYDEKGKLTLAEGQSVARFARGRAPGVGRSVDELYSHEAGIVAAVRRALAGESVRVQLRLREGDDWEGIVSPLLDENGHIAGATGIALDVSDRVRAEAERARLLLDEKAARAEAERALKLREEFISVASHELNTPLTSLQLQLGQLELLAKEGAVPEEALQHALEVGLRQTRRLGRLVADLIDASRVSTGQLALVWERGDLAALVRDGAARLERDRAKAGCPLTVETPERLEGRWDRMRLEQVLTNLLSNAFKYAPRSAVRVALERAGPGARLMVSDAGPGVPPELGDAIFELYVRGAGRRLGGLGLGLHIARQIVLAHGGAIRVERAPEGGALFTVDLPLD